MGGLTIADRWRMLNADARQQLMESDPFGLVPDHLVAEVERVGLPFALVARWGNEPGRERRFLREDIQNWIMGIANTRIASVTVTPRNTGGLDVQWQTTDIGFAEQTVLWAVTINLDDNSPLYQLGVKLVKLADHNDVHNYVFNHQEPKQFNLPLADRAVELGETSARAYFPASLLPALPPRYEWAATLTVDGIDVARFPE